jgi:hypothetical protein
MHNPAAGPSIALTPVVPVDHGVSTYTRFAGFFEPYEYTDWTVAPAPYKRDNRRLDVAQLPALPVR